jgi:hypothetical protein
VEITSQPVDPNDNTFWDQFWNETSLQSMSDVFTLIPGAEVRALREEIPSNLASLCYKAVEKLVKAAESSSLSTAEEQHVGKLQKNPREDWRFCPGYISFLKEMHQNLDSLLSGPRLWLWK